MDQRRRSPHAHAADKSTVRLGWVIFLRSIIVILFAAVGLVSCMMSPRNTTSTPTLEVSQVAPYRWEVIVRLHDEAVTSSSVQCGIYRVLGSGTNEVEGMLANIRLNRTEAPGEFIGIYSNGKEFPHGTTVVVLYQAGRGLQPVRASTKMYYH